MIARAGMGYSGGMNRNETNSLTSKLFAAINTRPDTVRVRLPMPEGGQTQLREELAQFSAAMGADVPVSLKVEGHELELELSEFGMLARALGGYFAHRAAPAESPALWQIDGSICAADSDTGHVVLLVPSADRDLSRVMTEQGPCAAVDLRDVLHFYKTDRTKFRDALQGAVVDVIMNLGMFPMRHFNDGTRKMITDAATAAGLTKKPEPTVERGQIIYVDFTSKDRGR